MDGTLCDYRGAIEEEFNKAFGDGDGLEWWNSEYDYVVDLIKKQPGFWRSLKKLELGFAIVDILKKYEFDLHILTKGPYRTTSAWTEKVEWCREHIPGVPVTITENKSLVYGKILVDDWPEYCEKWIKHRPRGTVIMPAYGYNKEFAAKYPGRVILASMDNLDEVEEVIKQIANG